MKKIDYFSQEIEGRMTMFMLKHFKDKQRPAYWLGEVKRVNVLIEKAKNALELKLEMQDYVKKMGRQFCAIFPGTPSRDFYKQLRGVLNDRDYSDKNILIAMAEEDKKAIDNRVRRLKRELNETVKEVKKECKELRKDLKEQSDEVSRLRIENGLLLNALIEMSKKHAELIEENDVDKLLKEISQLKSSQEDMSRQNQKLVKIISIIMKCPSREVEKLITGSEDTPGLLVLKLKQMSGKENEKAQGNLPTKLFSLPSCGRGFAVGVAVDENAQQSLVKLH